ncbi:MAG: tetratricopeptide repeat protein [Bacteroidales bacterium]|nr:tetratricopeptide repeat protein [Bacteroidales bacterium]
MTYRYLPIIVSLLTAIVTHAVTPLEHESVLQNPDKIIRKATPDDEEDPYFILTGEADAAIAAHDYPTAVLRLREAMRMDPDNPSNVLLLSNLGIVYTHLGQDSLALATYDEALAMAPAMTTVRENRALLKLKMGRDRDAYDDFGLVIERDSLSASARYYHGMIALYGGRLSVATQDFAVLQSVSPDSYNTQVAMGTMLSLSGHDREAIPYYKKLVEMEPAPEYYAALAGCYLAIGELSDASHTLGEAFRQCGEDPELYYYRAWLNKESYLMDAAKSDAKRAVELGVDPSKVQRLFAN